MGKGAGRGPGKVGLGRGGGRQRAEGEEGEGEEEGGGGGGGEHRASNAIGTDRARFDFDVMADAIAAAHRRHLRLERPEL